MYRVLYVEDDADAAAALAEYLRAAGLVAVLAGSGEQAIMMLDGGLPDGNIDLVITDLALPGIDGAELCRILRADQTHCHLPIILLTGVRQRMGIEISQADQTWLPADRILDKAVPPEDILTAVRELLEKAHPG